MNHPVMKARHQKESNANYHVHTDEGWSSANNATALRPHTGSDIRWETIKHSVIVAMDREMGLSHFILLKRVGVGDIGSVYLAELRGTNTFFAIKVMDKAYLASQNKLLRAQTEREILGLLDHPFLPSLYSYFETDKHYCLVMEFCSGGNLHTLRQKQPTKHFTEEATRFYTSQVLLALEYLHMLGIVYRDLKPENILIRDEGHIMLSEFDLSLRCSVIPTLVKSDFGVLIGGPLPELMAEPTNVKSMSFVGTHEYLAPEIIREEGHGSAVDWWTFGIFLYELLHGTTPFKGQENHATLFNVIGQPLRFPESPHISHNARDLIKGLLVKEPHKRIAYRRGATEIKQHPFFEGVNWALVRSAHPPHVPEPMDFSQFAVEKVSENKKNSSNDLYGKFKYF